MTDDYTKLSSGFSLLNGLYRTDKYLLLVDRSLGSESYRRVYFRDIQSIQFLKTARWIVSGVACFCVSVLVFLLTWAIFAANMPGAGSFFALLGLVLAGGGVYTLVRGPTCRVYACTAVQRVQLPTVARVSHAQHFLDRIQPLINAEQGELTREEMNEKLKEGWDDIRAKVPAPKKRVGVRTIGGKKIITRLNTVKSKPRTGEGAETEAPQTESPAAPEPVTTEPAASPEVEFDNTGEPDREPGT